MKANYIKFEEYIVKPIYRMYGFPCDGSISDDIKDF